MDAKTSKCALQHEHSKGDNGIHYVELWRQPTTTHHTSPTPSSSLMLQDPLRFLLPCWSLRSLAEAILETARKSLEILHAASSWRTAALRLVCPLIRTNLLCRITTCCAGLLLKVEGTFAAANTQTVCFLVAFT